MQFEISFELHQLSNQEHRVFKMKNTMTFCNRADFTFIAEYLSHYDFVIENCDIDLLYESIKEEFEQFEVSKYFIQNTSYLQAVKDYFNKV